MDMEALTKNCCSFDSGVGVIARLGNKYATIVLDLNDKDLQSSQFYINEVTSSNGKWTFLVTDGNAQSLGSFVLDRAIASIVKVGFNGVMYAGNVINGMSFDFGSVVNIDELNASQNKIMYIEVEL